MTSSGKNNEADADVLGVGLYEGQVKSGHPLLLKSISKNFLSCSTQLKYVYRGKFVVLRTYSSLPSNS